MNDLYFRCEECKRFIDAGYRWAYVTLVRPGIVAQDDFAEGGNTLPDVSAAAVLAADEYWKESDGDARSRAALASQLKQVKLFLQQHQAHRLSFGDMHRFHSPEDEWLEWLSEGDAPLPRNLVEVLGFSTWAEVETLLAHGPAPWWWAGGKNRAAARQRFDALVRARRG